MFVCTPCLLCGGRGVVSRYRYRFDLVNVFFEGIIRWIWMEFKIVVTILVLLVSHFTTIQCIGLKPTIYCFVYLLLRCKARISRAVSFEKRTFFLRFLFFNWNIFAQCWTLLGFKTWGCFRGPRSLKVFAFERHIGVRQSGPLQ